MLFGYCTSQSFMLDPVVSSPPDKCPVFLHHRRGVLEPLDPLKEVGVFPALVASPKDI